MIILAGKFGQLGNRLAHLRAYLCFALEHGVKLVDLSLDEYAGSFRARHPLARVMRGAGSAVLRRSLPLFAAAGPLSLVRPDAQGEVRLVEPSMAQRFTGKNVVVSGGWPVVHWDVVKKHDTAVREFFSLKERPAANVLSFLARARKGCDLLIGIHVRQGDYREWDGGRHYFETPRYAAMMAKLVAMHQGAAVRFVVCSNVPQHSGIFAGLDVLEGPADPVEAMYVLAGCDEIYGPKSSFSGWSSFYGGVPLRWIEAPELLERATNAAE